MLLDVHEKGIALLEFSIILPVLILLVFGAFEMSRGVYLNNVGIEFGQDVATSIFHECKDKDLSDSYPYTAQAATTCINNELSSLHSDFRKKQPRAAVVVTIFKNGASGIEIFAGPVRACQSKTIDFNCDDIQSHVSLSRAQQEFASTLSKTGSLILVETFVKTDGVLERALPTLDRDTQTYYSATVF